jgi:uncharacterized protein YccT (UPF0319 family)
VNTLLTSPQQWKASYRNTLEEYKIKMAKYNKNKGNAAVADLVEEDEAPEEGEPSQSLAQRHDHHTRSLSPPLNARR